MKKNKTGSPEFDSGREFAIVVEGLRSEFRVFAEDMTSVKKTVKEVRINQANTLQRVKMLELSNRKILKDTAEIKSMLAGHELRLVKLEEK